MALYALGSTPKPAPTTAQTPPGLSEPTSVGSMPGGAAYANDEELRRKRAAAGLSSAGAANGQGVGTRPIPAQQQVAPSSPVNSSGQIVAAPPTGQAQPQQQVQPQAAAPSIPSPAPGWVQYGDGWVPPDHPLAMQQAAANGAGGGVSVQGSATALQTGNNYLGGMQTYTPGQIPQVSQATYNAPQAYTPGVVPALQAPAQIGGAAQYQPGQAPTLQAFQQLDPSAQYQPGQLGTGDLPTYQGAQFGQFQAPGSQASNEAMTNALLQQVMANPQSMSPEIVAQLKEQQKEQALSMQQQTMEQLQQAFAGRGMGQSGNLDMQRRRIADDTVGQILGGQRQIDIAAGQTNLQDRLNALQAAEQTMTGQSNRGLAGYQAQLAGQQAQAGEGYKQYGSQADSTRFALERALQGEGLKQAGAQSALNFGQAQAGITNMGNQTAMQQAAQQEANRQAAAQSSYQTQQANVSNQQNADQLGLQQWQAQEAARQQAAQQAMQSAQFGAEFGLNREQSELQRWQANQGAQQQGAGLSQSAAQLGLQQALGFGGLDIDRQRLAQEAAISGQGMGLEQQRLAENSRQFDSSQQLNMLNFLNQAAMGRYDLGVDYATLQQQLMQYLGGR